MHDQTPLSYLRRQELVFTKLFEPFLDLKLSHAKTAEALGVGDSFNPEHNINAGVRYFRKLLDQFDGDVKLALAAYNAGSRKVRKYNGIPPFKATRCYIKKVFEYHQYYKKQMAW